jgi:hypothetical protein
MNVPREALSDHELALRLGDRALALDLDDSSVYVCRQVTPRGECSLGRQRVA